MKIPLLFSCLIFLFYTGRSQCPNNNAMNTTYNASSLTLNSRTSIGCCVWGGEYIVMSNMTAGRTYRLDVCGESDDTYLTIFSSSGGSALDFNDNACSDDAQIDFVVPSTGSYHVLLDIGASCGSNTNNHAVYATDLGTLPVTFGAFEAEQKGQLVALEWSTISELNNQGFEVQRSTDATTWEGIHFEEGVGTSLARQQYAYQDPLPTPGQRYYRLQQIDLNGNSTYSGTVSVNVTHQGTGISLGPNPATSTFDISLITDNVGVARLTMYDLAGQLVRNEILTSDTPLIESSVGVADLKRGIYLVEVQAGQAIWRRKLLLQ